MKAIAQFIREHGLDRMRIAGRQVGEGRERVIEVRHPYTSERLGSVPKATVEEVR
jgi:phosphonoacetaldehyde dehydrogenase